MGYSFEVWRVLLGGSLLLLPCAAASAQASEAPAQSAHEDEAREAFRRGSEAATEERWADSEREFRRAYELSGVTSALYNQAVALRALGRHVEARAAFDVLLQDPDALDPRVREEAERIRREAEARIATLVLAGLGAEGAEVRIALDGEETRDDGSRPLELEVDPGHHALTVERPGFESFRWSGDLEPNAAETIEVSLVALPELTPEVIVVERTTPGTSVVEEAWFWVVLAVLVLGAAAGTVTGLMLDAQLEGESVMVFRL